MQLFGEIHDVISKFCLENFYDVISIEDVNLIVYSVKCRDDNVQNE